HGNHATCGRFEGAGPGRFDINVQYTFTGTCPPGYVVVPSHAGYTYLAERLASWGYIVVSIKANRGVNAAPGVADDRGLNLRRGRLVLQHLQRLRRWDAAARAAGAQAPAASRRVERGRRRAGEPWLRRPRHARFRAPRHARALARRRRRARRLQPVSRSRQPLAGADRTDRLRSDLRDRAGRRADVAHPERRRDVVERAAADVRRRRVQPAGRKAVRSHDVDPQRDAGDAKVDLHRLGRQSQLLQHRVAAQRLAGMTPYTAAFTTF